LALYGSAGADLGRSCEGEGAGGLGHLLAQQLLAAGEQVVDVQPKLGARVRLLSTGTSNKNDPDDALGEAIPALAATAAGRPVGADHARVGQPAEQPDAGFVCFIGSGRSVPCGNLRW